MKKILCTLLAILMVTSALILTSCNKEENLKFGMGVYTSTFSATDATQDVNGKGNIASTVAAVLLDNDGKIVKCELDTADNTVEYTAEGKFISVESFKTKYELGKNYNMVAYGGAKAEWFEQADAFEKAIVGKTVDEVKALVSEGNKGTDEVINAGCTIKINEFVLAIEKAAKNAKDSAAVASSTLKIGVATSMKGTDAVKAAGSIELDTTFVAMVLDADNKVVASVTDTVAPKFTFDAKGAATTDTKAVPSTKLELGASYGMAWFEHAAAFDAACAGKNATEIAALAANGVAGEALQNAGCTIYVGNFVNAAVKAATVG